MKHNRIKYKFNEDKIDMDNPIFCYFIGLVSTDGYISVKTPKIAKRKYTDYLEFYSGVKKGKDSAKWFYQGFDEIKLFCKYKKYLTVRDNDIVRTIENKKSIEL